MNFSSGKVISFLQNGYSEVIAAPGVEDWRGECNTYEP